MDGLPVVEFAFPGALRDRLVAAVLAGEKTATTSLLAEWEEEGETPPTPGRRAAVVDSDGRRVAVIETTATRVLRIAEVVDGIAQAEGEGFAGVADWRAEHERFWRSFRDDPLTDDTLVVVEWFRRVG